MMGSAATFPTYLHILIVLTVLLNHAISPVRSAFSSRPDEKRFELPDSGIIAAFTDVNTDQKTDILLIDRSLRSFSIMKHEDKDDFESRILSLSQRCFMTEDIVSLVPCDFTGDTFVDIAVISVNISEPKLLNIRLAIGSGPKAAPIDCSRLNETADYTTSVQPLLLDYNGDMIGDLLIVSDNKRLIILGSSNDTTARQVIEFPVEEQVAMRQLHSNNFVDFNGDDVADIVIETEEYFEYWYAHPNGSYGDAAENGKRKPSRKMSRPKVIDGHEVLDTGISIFADFDGDSVQEHLMPVNLRINGVTQAAILMSRSSDFQWLLLATNFSPSNETENLVFHEEKFPDPYSGPITFARSIRQGDVNSDGYPDLVSIMSGNNMPPSIVTLKSVAASNGNRTFVFMSKAPTTRPLVAAFMDLTESGSLDVIYSSRSTSKEGSEVMAMGCIMNTVAMESYFLKIMVASGRCPLTGCIEEGWWVQRDLVNYGSNIPGPYIWYSLQDVTGMRKKSGAGQMTSASHFALQTPYLVFGLGEYANYIDKITITIPFRSPAAAGEEPNNKRVREEEQIVPDAQIVIVPRLEAEPFRWITKMWISITGNQIKHTGYTLYLIFCILLIIIMALHKKEVMEDADENKRFKQNWLDHRR